MQFVKRNSFGLAALVVAACAASVVVAAPAKKERANDPAMHVVRASALNGIHVKNANDENLGKVEDVVIDMNTGKIRYAVVSFGGFRGVGDKLFAVPFHAMKAQHNSADKSTHFILNVDKEKLKKSPGFDKNNWPDFGDPTFGERNDPYYITETKATSK